MKTIQLFAFLSLLLVAVSSCEKSGDIVDPPSNTELLSDGPWMLTAQMVDPAVEYNGVPVTDEFAQLDQCIKDNLLDFIVTNGYTRNEGATKCDEADSQIIEAGTWSLSEEETVLTFDEENGGQTIRTLSSVNRDNLVLIETFEQSGLTFTRTRTYVDID